MSDFGGDGRVHPNPTDWPQLGLATMTEKVSLRPAEQDPLHLSAGGLCSSCPGLSWKQVWGVGWGESMAYLP